MHNSKVRHAELLIGGHFVGGPCDQSTPKAVIRSPYDSAIVGTAAEAGASEVRAAFESALEAFLSWKNSPTHQRQKLLREVAAIVRQREGELVELLALEIGKPLAWGRGETKRLALTFDLAADFLDQVGTESLPLDFDPRGKDYRCGVQRFPIGVIFCIVPYNWPFNLAAHKIAPALAAGNTVLLKTSPLAPISTLTLARIIHEAGCPPGVLNALNAEPAALEGVLNDPRLAMLSFTGSPKVGWKLKAQLPEKKVLLELGGDASTIVWEDADLDWALPRLVSGGYGYAGQICISIQHIWVHESRYEEVKKQLIQATEGCAWGDPLDEKTVCGPMISSDEAQRVLEWVTEAEALGAKVIAGGNRVGNVVLPTLVEGVPEGAKLTREEVFGPVMTLSPVRSLEEAIQRANASAYGIQAGVFTQDASVAEKFYRELEVAGVVINDYPTLRFDNMPYGGIKHSGFGREGVRYAFEEMTETKVMLSRVGKG